MHVNFDHAHIFASNIDQTVDFFQRMFRAEILWDTEAAGSRNIRLAIGKGFIHLYDQPPKIDRAGNIHHLGLETDDLDALVAHMKDQGFSFQNEVRDLPKFKYVMVAAPDNILIELFQVKNRRDWRVD